MDIVFEFIKKNGGIIIEDNYFYEGIDGKCDVLKDNGEIVMIDGYEDVFENDEDVFFKVVVN